MKLYSLDAEVNGLYGPTFAIGVTVRIDGKETAQFQARLPDTAVTHPWGITRALPAITGMQVTHRTTEEMEEAFWQFWMEEAEGATVIAHCGSPVESGLSRRCVGRDVEARQFLGPYPAVNDVATLLLLLGEQPDSVDSYVVKYDLHVPFKGKPHHPYYDAIVAAVVWEHAVTRLKVCPPPVTA